MRISVEIKKEYPITPDVIIHCSQKNQEVKELLELLGTKQKNIVGTINHKEYIIKPSCILYCEYVDGNTYIYTEKEVYKSTLSLNQLTYDYGGIGFFRCSKSAVLNINMIDELKSEMGNRIDAKLMNGEHIIISRRYSKSLRALLKGVSEE